MSWSAMTSVSDGVSRSVSLPRPHQLTSIAPAPAALIHAACCSMTFVDRESYAPSFGM
jgi:hypothetical protein